MAAKIKLVKEHFPVLTRQFADDLNVKIAPTDGMYKDGNYNHYFSTGASALANVFHALSVTECFPDRILDFGCGAGRVTRWLGAAFPGSVLEGCDIRQDDVKFVAANFGAKTWISGTDVDKLEPPSSYDLIWVGSVFTHLSESVSVKLFDKLASWLNPKGSLVFTSHGRKTPLIGESAGFYGIADDWLDVLTAYRRDGFGYADYASTPGYGISVTQLSWWANLIASRDNLRLVSMSEHSWDNHQDVIGVQRRLE